MAHPNAVLIRRLYDDFAAGDMDAITKQLAKDVVIHVPGRHPLAGDYKGPDGFVEFAMKNVELAGPSLHVELEDVLADDRRAVTFEHITAERDGRHLDVRDSTLFRFKRGKIIEMVMLSGNPYAHDEFWA